MIKEEKQNTELRAEELESRVGNLDIQEDTILLNHQNFIKSTNSPINSGRSTPSQAKSDLFKLSLNKNKDNFKCMTAPPGMSAKYMEIFNDEYLTTNDSINEDAKDYSEKYLPLYGKNDQILNRQQLDGMEEHKLDSLKRNIPQNLDNLNSSPSSSKNSSNESLNYILRKDSINDQNSQITNSNSIDYSLNNLNLSKKKSLKTTLYRIFTQRKKSNIFKFIN